MSMNVRIIGIVTLVMLLAQKCAAKPLPEVEATSMSKYEQLLNEVNETENTKKLTPREELILFALKQFNTLANYFEETSTQLVESCLKDDRILKSEDAEVQQFKEHLENFLRAVEKTNKFEDRIELMESFSKLVDPYDLEEKTDPTENEKLIASVLDDNGLGQLNQDFGQRFLDGLDHIAVEFEKYLSTLNEEEFKQFKEYSTFMEKLKAQKTNDDKIKFIFEFIDDHEGSEETKE